MDKDTKNLIVCPFASEFCVKNCRNSSNRYVGEEKEIVECECLCDVKCDQKCAYDI